jgi:hypothetical protein
VVLQEQLTLVVAAVVDLVLMVVEVVALVW